MWLMGNPTPVAVSANTYTKFADNDTSDSENSKFGDAKDEGTFDVEDLAMGMIRFDNGAVLQIEFSWASNIKEENRFVELRGTKAGLKWEDNEVEFFTEEDGQLLKPMRHLQTANVFALKHGITEGAAREGSKALLLKSIREHGDCLQTGFLGTSFIMDALTSCGVVDVAYTLLLQHKNPSWLYSVDQGATTVWERWNSYTKKDGFGPVGMNSFNHYAYGAVVGWIYRTVAGISADARSPGFKNVILAPKPDRRLKWVKAEYQSAAGLIKSAWRYEGEKWIWEFTLPQGATATVTIPGEKASALYSAGTYTVSAFGK